MESAALRLDGAIRTSKRKADARSPQQQRDLITNCCDVNGHRLQTIHDSGRDESGKTMHRDTLRLVMDRVRAGLTDGLIVGLTDRLGRAPIEEAMAYVRELDGVGYLVLADAGGGPVDLSEPSAESNLVFQLQMARQYWLATAKRFQMSQTEAIKAGKFIGPTPLGYRREQGRLFEHDKFGPIIRQAYRLAAQPDGIHVAVAYLERAVPGRRWDTDHVRRLLRSRTYLGESRSGRLVNTHAHAPLTTPEDWTAAQTAPRMRRSKGDYPLSHLVHCARCGHGLVGQLQTVPRSRRRAGDWRRHEPDNAPPRRYRRMRCSNPACRGGSTIRAEKLERYVREAMRDALRGDRLRARFPGLDSATAWDALSRAQEAQSAFAVDIEYQEALGREPALRTARGHAERVERARAAHTAAAVAEAQARAMPTADQMDDDERLARAIRVGRVSIVVAPGRGSVEDRVVVKFDGDDGAGMLAP